MSLRFISQTVFSPRLPPYVGPGDLGVPFTAFWGVRAFSYASIGVPVIQLRRSSDNASAIFSASQPNGLLNYQAISDFAGAGTLFIQQLFDQTGNGFHVTPPAQANEIVFTLNAVGGKGAIDNTAVTATTYNASGFDFSVAKSFSGHFVARTSSATFQHMWGDNDGNFSMSISGSTAQAQLLGAATINAAFALSQWHAAAGVFDQTNSPISFINVDNVVTVLGNESGAHGTGNIMGLFGEFGPSVAFKGFAGEVGFYQGAPTAPWTQAQAASVVGNARVFWGV